MPRVPSESTATSPAAAPPPARCPRHAALLGAQPTDPTLLGRTRKRRWQEGGTHRYASLVSAESELGTLPVSSLLPRSLHTRSPLGRSAPYYAAPTATPTATMCAYVTRALYPWEGRSLEYSSVTLRARVPSESTATSPAAAPPPSMPPTCIPRHAALLGAEPTDPTLLGRTRKRRWQEGGMYSHARLVSAESELGTLPVSSLLLRSLHTRSALGRSAPYYAAPTATMCPYGARPPYPIGRTPLEYSSVTSRARVPSESTATSPAAAPPRLDAPQHASPDMPRCSEQSRPIRPSSAARASAAGNKGALTVVKAW